MAAGGSSVVHEYDSSGVIIQLTGDRAPPEQTWPPQRDANSGRRFGQQGARPQGERKRRKGGEGSSKSRKERRAAKTQLDAVMEPYDENMA